MPPVLSSIQFTPAIAQKVVHTNQRKKDGYDAVEYRLTRFNGVARLCAIPHPVPYSEVVLSIAKNWNKLKYIALNKHSIIRPRVHPDGRLIIMEDYGSHSAKAKKGLASSFGRRFTVHTDISNCFPSIYTHSVSWATVGMAAAKQDKKACKKWFSKMDRCLQALKRNETNGVAIGPATSNVVAEAILARVDQRLQRRFRFHRFIDDYTAFCQTEEDAQNFIRTLSEELAKYKLLLHLKKTEVGPLPRAIGEEWVTELASALPRGNPVNEHDALTYLNLMVHRSKLVPDGSVLKYGLRALSSRNCDEKAKSLILEYGLTLSFHHPALLPVLDHLLTEAYSRKITFVRELQRIAKENAKFRRSDGLAWALYYLNKFGVSANPGVATAIIKSQDCVGLLLLYKSMDPAHQRRVRTFVQNLDSSDFHVLDQYWLLLYEMYRDGAIKNPYGTEQAFKVLEDNKVRFYDADGFTTQLTG